VLTEPITLPKFGEPDASAQLHDILTELVQLSGRVTRMAHKAMPDPATPATWRTLAVLQESGPVRLGELASLCMVAQPTMTKMVAGLVEREWVKRIADADDARAWQIAISTKGLLVLREWRSALAARLVPVFDGLDAHDLKTLRRAMDLIRPRVDLSARSLELQNRKDDN
jgi:DNA-binding MarR family transcriptional regulator